MKLEELIWGIIIYGAIGYFFGSFWVTLVLFILYFLGKRADARQNVLNQQKHNRVFKQGHPGYAKVDIYE